MSVKRLFASLCLASAGAASVAAPVAGVSGVGAQGDAKVSILSADQVIQILDETVDWYRTLGAQQQNADQPSDMLILFANQQTADKVVALSFEIARANAELLSSEAAAGQSAPDATSAQSMKRQKVQMETQREALLTEMAPVRQQLQGIGKGKADLEAKLRELEGELSMIDARKNLLETMADFVNESNPQGAGANALKAHIDAIAATVPPASGHPAMLHAEPVKADPGRFGIWALSTDAIKLHSKIKTIDAIDHRTAELAATFNEISARPLKQLKAYLVRSDALAAEADNVTGTALQALRGQFDTLAWLFRQTSSIFIPLSKEQVLLQQYLHNLHNWREGAVRQYKDALAALGVRLGFLASLLAAVFIFAEAWRRAVQRYAHDPRRRYQLLLVRKIVMWAMVILIIGLSFVTEISTFATFAGLLTAGVAVAMQSVLVSVVGYFFLIGKYGIRVGDRIQIGTVVGEVIDLGLVRMHLMEMNQQGPLGPTGRVVAFANLIVFQASGGLFKQIPGVSLSWHETTVRLPEVADYAALKEKLLAAIGAVLIPYREEIDRQRQELERNTVSGAASESEPQVQMHLADGRMEARIGYPVHLKHAAQMDEMVAEAILRVMGVAKGAE